MNSNYPLRRLEPALLFSVIFLPGYLAQALAQSGMELFNDSFLLLFYLFTAIPQTLLVLYMVYRDGLIPPAVYGIGPLNRKTFLLLLPALAGVFLALIPVFFLNFILYVSGLSLPWEPLDWNFTNTRLIPLVFLSCLGTGYLEESYFRSYLSVKMEFQGIPRNRILIFINLLFAAGHLYQGIPGFLGTFAIGVYLSLVFYRRRDLHLIALTHGFYNFAVLMAGIFAP